MPAVVPQRLRVPLRSPQAVSHTSAVLWRPRRDAGKAAVVLGHGAGSDMTNAVLVAVGRGLAERGHPVAAFNFAYTEAGRKRPDPASRLEAAFRDVIAAVRAQVGQDRPTLFGGRSMGGRMASHLAAQGDPCAGLVLLGYPLHLRRRADPDATGPVGDERLRVQHWPAVRAPVLFVQGERDALCDLDLLRRERKRLVGPSTLHVLAGADHGFGVRRQDGRTRPEILDEVVRVVGEWVGATAPGRIVPPARRAG